jgi:hypothetical protein
MQDANAPCHRQAAAAGPCCRCQVKPPRQHLPRCSRPSTLWHGPPELPPQQHAGCLPPHTGTTSQLRTITHCSSELLAGWVCAKPKRASTSSSGCRGAGVGLSDYEQHTRQAALAKG